MCGERVKTPPEGPGSDLVGQTLRNTYRILRVLDQGGMGMVFDAEHVRLRRRVAVKVLAQHLAGVGNAIARFHLKRTSSAAFSIRTSFSSRLRTRRARRTVHRDGALAR